jgi:hypothetical protein
MLLDCSICGNGLGLVESLTRRWKGVVTFPMIVLTGKRQEIAVDGLCPRCARQAEAIRGAAAPGEILARGELHMR